MSATSSKLSKILQPKLNGFTGPNKPIVLIVGSPYDEITSATKVGSKVDFMSDVGYGVLNKQKKTQNFTFDTSPEEFGNYIKAANLTGKPLTICLQAHGAPGWLFGENGNAKSELKETYQFSKFIRHIEEHTGAIVDSIILSGCYNAVEMYNAETGAYYNSPARMLSYVLPDKDIIGFIGQNADAKITNVYTKTDESTYEHKIVNPKDAAVLFRGGSVVSSPSNELYCTHKYTPAFIEGALSLGLTTEEDHFKPVLAKEMFDETSYLYVDKSKNNLGVIQERTVPVIRNKLEEDFPIVEPLQTAILS